MLICIQEACKVYLITYLMQDIKPKTITYEVGHYEQVG